MGAGIAVGDDLDAALVGVAYSWTMARPSPVPFTGPVYSVLP